MGRNIVTIERNELYKQVWNEPVSKVALKYRISDVGLKKICKKLRVPTPPRGHWAKVQNGVSVKRIPLPKLKYGEPDTYEIRVDESEKPQLIFGSEAIQLISRVERWKEIKVPQKLRSPHPLIAETRDSYAQSKPDKYGRFRPWKKRYLDIRVTLKSLNRALQIMDALIKKLEELGFEIIVKEGYHSATTKVKNFGENISFFLFEKVLQVDHVRASDIDLFHDINILLAFPEYKVPLPGGTRPLQNDVFVLAKGGDQLISIMIEGKVSEPFGELVCYESYDVWFNARRTNQTADAPGRLVEVRKEV
jgi:hypothetical protein